MIRRILASCVVVSLAVCIGCTDTSDHSRTAPATTGPAPVTSGAWTEVARFSSGTRYGVNVVNRGFGVSGNGELVLAGGQESQINQPPGGPRAEMEFYNTVSGTTSVTEVRTGILPASLIKPRLVTLNGVMYVLNGYTQTATFPAVSRAVLRYQPASNNFAAEDNDPEPTTSSYYVVSGPSIFRITPPYAMRGPTQPGSVGKFTPGSAWVNTNLSGPIPSNAAVCADGNQLYLFGGQLSGTNNRDVYTINLDTAQVTKTPVQTSERIDGIAMLSSGEIHLIGGGSQSTGQLVPTPAESYRISNGQVAVRPDLEAFFYLSEPQVSGDLVYVFDPRGNGFTVFRYRP